MPAIIAHHLFGTEIYSELRPVIGAGGRARGAFLLGNLGPDPLLCLKALPAAVPFRDIGSVMHAERPAQLLHALHERCATCEDEAVRAWALGFLCHYLLDSAAHPLVYAQQDALCAAGSGAAATGIDGGAVHAAIETEFDEHVLHWKLGIDVSGFSPHREALECPGEALGAISEGLSDIVSDAYGRAVPPPAYALSVRLYRAAQRVVDSKREGLRRRVDYARLTGRRYPHVLALTHSTRGRNATFANEDHVPWPHPFEPGAVVRESFEELYGSALERTAETVPKFASADFSADACEKLTGGLNFRGERAAKQG